MESGETLTIITIAVGVIGLILTVIFKLSGHYSKKQKKKKAHFDVVWKHATALTPEDVMGFRGRKEHGFDEYYLPRKIDDRLKELIQDRKNVIVIGRPLSGKTRSVYEAIKSLHEQAVVTVPNKVDTYPPDLEIPANNKVVDFEIVVIDDVGKFMAKPNFAGLLRRFSKCGTVIVATCWIDEQDVVRQKLAQEAGVLFEDYLAQDDISKELAEDVANKVGRNVPKSFDGNIGSIFFDLDEMRRRFSGGAPEEKAFLRSVKRLYQAGIYEGREVFDLDKIKAVASKAEGLNGRQYRWTELVGKLVSKGFLTREKKGLHSEEAYLQQYIIEDDFSDVVDFQLLANLFPDDPGALFSIGNQAFNRGLADLQKANYMRIAIKAYREALRVYTYEDFPMDYGVTQNNLGSAYRNLAEVTDKASNCGNAISAFKKAMRVRTYEDFPMDYGMTQNNLGNAYSTLAEVSDKSSNCVKAIEAYREALRVCTYEDFPIQYGVTQNNLGTAYRTLAEVSDKSSNCVKAIEACREALRVRTYEDFPIRYGMTQDNLGSAYSTLADVSDKSSNCVKAIEAYREALRVRTYEDFPIDYGKTRNNLGTAHGTLAVVADTVSNCSNAIADFKEALRVRTYEDFPIQYGQTQNNLGAVYRTLAEVTDKAANCGNAIAAYGEALRIRTNEDFPMDYGVTQFNLGIAYWTLAEAVEKEANCLKAREVLESAMTVFAEQKLPDWHRDASDLLEALAAFCEGVDESDS